MKNNCTYNLNNLNYLHNSENLHNLSNNLNIAEGWGTSSRARFPTPPYLKKGLNGKNY